MYDEQAAPPAVLAAATAGLIGLPSLVPSIILGVLITVVLATIVLRIRRHRANPR